MKIAISSWSFRYFFQKEEMNLLDFVDEVKNLGADGFEIFPEHVGSENFRDNLKKVVARAESLNLNISSLIAANDFALPEIEQRALQVKDMKEKIRAASEVGIDRVNVFTGYHQDGQDPVMESLRVKDCYREVIPVAEENDILLCLENHSSVHRDADGILSLINYLGSKNLKTNPDPTNFCQNHTQVDESSREIIYTETKKIAPYMANAHLKINTFDQQGRPEYVDVPRILEIYKNNNYDGDIVLEYFGEGNPMNSVKKGISYLRKVL